MEIKTKLDLDDAVYFMSKNKVTCGKVMLIKTTSELTGPSTNSLDSRTHIVYLADVLKENKYIEIDEEFAFGTKKELLESL